MIDAASLPYSGLVCPRHEDVSADLCAANGCRTARLTLAAPELLHGCNAMLGLIQLIRGRDDLPAELRDVLRSNHRIAEAEAAVAMANDNG
jgi:hypothetical protein